MKLLGFVLLMLALTASTTAAPRDLVLDRSVEHVGLHHHVEFLEDPDHALTIESIVQEHHRAFQPYPHRTVNESYTQSAWWFRFSLYNNEQEAMQWWLNMAYAMTDYIDIYHVDNESAAIIPIGSSGDKRPFDSRPVSTHNFWFPLDLPSHRSITFYVRVQTSGSMALPMQLYNDIAFVDTLSNQRLWLGLYHGGAFFLMLYNIGLFLVVRERLYLYYVLYVGCFLMISLTSTGLGYEYLWSSMWIQSGSVSISALLCSLFGGLFSRHLLALKERSKPLYDASSWLLALTTALMIASLFISYSISTRLAMLMVVLWIGFAVVAGCHGILQRYAPARIFAIAWFTFLASSLIFIMNSFKLLEANDLSIYVMQIGSAIELLLLSFAIASRISLLKRQKDEITSVAEAENVANKAKSEFLASMSHEIRTPMAGVLGMTELMGNTQLTQEQRQYLDNIQDSSRALLDIINQILDLSKIEANKLVLESLEFSLDDVLRETLKVFYAKRQHFSPVRLELQIDPSIPAQVCGDPTRLRQVLINLIGNAYKFTERGTITIALQPGKQPHELLFTITDTGPGIAADAIPHLFQSYAQENASTARKHGGTGLGLAITKQLVERMGGEIGVHSSAGVGSTFWFQLPLINADLPDPILPTSGFEHVQLYLFSNDNLLQRQISLWCKHMNINWVLNAWPNPTEQTDNLVILSDDIVHLRQSQSLLAVRISCHLLCLRKRDCEQTEFPASELPLQPSRFLEILSQRSATANALLDSAAEPAASQIHIKKVLLAEDNPVNAQVIKGLLKRLGVDSDWCQNGKEAVEKVQRNHYDLIFMDCEMPILDGYAATRQIRESGETTLPIVALTAHAVKEYVDQAYAAGMNDYLTKPVDLITLRKALQYWSSPNI